jgi:hypothetical protein
MASTVTRPAVDVAPRSARPGLALLLAILSIPGSTVAWDLPAGGLWIGLPLGVAAIVLALRARREHVRGAGSTMAIAALVLAGLALGSMAIWTIVSIAG